MAKTRHESTKVSQRLQPQGDRAAWGKTGITAKMGCKKLLGRQGLGTH